MSRKLAATFCYGVMYRAMDERCVCGAERPFPQRLHLIHLEWNNFHRQSLWNSQQKNANFQAFCKLFSVFVWLFLNWNYILIETLSARNVHSYCSTKRNETVRYREEKFIFVFRSCIQWAAQKWNEMKYSADIGHFHGISNWLHGRFLTIDFWFFNRVKWKSILWECSDSKWYFFSIVTSELHNGKDHQILNFGYIFFKKK